MVQMGFLGQFHLSKVGLWNETGTGLNEDDTNGILWNWNNPTCPRWDGHIGLRE